VLTVVGLTAVCGVCSADTNSGLLLLCQEVGKSAIYILQRREWVKRSCKCCEATTIMHCVVVHSRWLGLTMSIVVMIYNIVNRIYTVPSMQHHVEC
jgi:hypothetical protein